MKAFLLKINIYILAKKANCKYFGKEYSNIWLTVAYAKQAKRFGSI